MKARPAATVAERRSWSVGRTPTRSVLELVFDVGPEESVTWLTIDGSTGEPARRRHGVELPFEDGSFDRVVCSEGLQLLPDRGRALAEMRRVLVRGGEIEVAVPGSIEGNPPFAELADSLERHAGVRGAAAIRWLFCMPEPDDLRGVLAASGFQEILIDVARTTFRCRSIAEVLSRSNLDPLIMPEIAKRRVLADLEHGLEPRVDQDGLVFTSETIIGRARRG